MGFLAALDDPWIWGESGTSNIVPGTYDVAVDGHPYMIDTTFEFGRRDSYRHASIPATRVAQDITNIPGEQTINVQGLWRREANDWSMGAGQRFSDRDGSFPNRFRASQGVDVFTNKWYTSLLPDTTKVVVDTDASLQVLVVGAYVYKLNSTTLQFTSGTLSSSSTWTTVTGMPASGIVMAATNGNDVWIACGTSLLYHTTAGAAAATQLVTSGSSGAGVYFVAYCSNVLLVAQGPSVYQIVASGALPTALITQNNSAWTWTAACGGYGWIYLAGYAGNLSTIYATQYQNDGTALTAPTISGPLPPGERCYALYPFVNFILVGTSLGARFCITLGPVDAGGSPGDLKIGPIIPNLVQPVTYPVRCFTSWRRFAYFGWSNYSSVSTGLGILDISQFTGEQTPAYASHLMATAQGEVTSMGYFNGSPVFSVKGVGIYSAATTYVPNGVIQSGYITYGIPDQKLAWAYSVDVVEPVNGSITAAITADDATPQSLGTSQSDPVPIFNIDQIRGEVFETTLTLNAGSTNTTTPIVRRATLQALPTITAGTSCIVALRLFWHVETRSGLREVNVPAEVAYLENLRSTQKVITYQEGSTSYTGTVIDVDVVYYERSTHPSGFFNGVGVVTINTLGGLIT